MRPVVLALLLALLAPAAAHAYPKLPEPLPPVAGNPAERLAELPIEDPAYDRATKCSKRAKPGVVAMTEWLAANARGVFWGTYRCERWGKRSASLHAENRAIDWHLDASLDADARAADRLFRLLLAPDSLGNPHALARRMGVQELIFDCGYWGAGMANFVPYDPCFTRSGKRRRGVDRTTAHRDHIHIGMSKDGAMGRTSFWGRA
jgi:hypothetical protein